MTNPATNLTVSFLDETYPGALDVLIENAANDAEVRLKDMADFGFKPMDDLEDREYFFKKCCKCEFYIKDGKLTMDDGPWDNSVWNGEEWTCEDEDDEDEDCVEDDEDEI